MNTLTVPLLDIPEIVSAWHIPADAAWTTGDVVPPASNGFVRFSAMETTAPLNSLTVEVLIDGAWVPATLEQALLASAGQIIEILKLTEAA